MFFDKKTFLRHKYFITIGGMGFVLYIFSLILDYDMFEVIVNFLNRFEKFELDEFFLFSIFILVGVLLDFVTYREIEAQIYRRKEGEKKHFETMNSEMEKHIQFLHKIANDFSQPLMALFGFVEVFEMELEKVENLPKDKIEERLKTLQNILELVEDIMKNLREETKSFSK